MARTKYINKKESTTTTSQNKWKSSTLLDQGYFKIIPSGIVKFKGEKDYLSTKSISWDKIKKIESKITLNSRPSRANMQPIQNSVWFAKMKNTIKVYYFDNTNADETNRFILSTGFLGVACNDTIIPNFLKYVFLSQKFNSIKDSLTKGSTQQAINNSALEQITIPIPPLDDQKEIAYILQRIEDAIEFQNKIITTVKMLKEVLMHKLLTEGIGHKEFKNTEIGKIPKDWSIVNIEKIAKQQKHIIINSNNFISFEHIESGSGKIIKVGDATKYKTKAPFLKGTLLYGRIRPYLNKVWFADRDGFCSTDIIRITPIDCDPLFLKHILLSQKFVEFATLHSSGVKMPRVNWKSIKTFKLAFPTFSEQQKIVQCLSTIDVKLNLEEQRKRILEHLFTTILNKLMSGEIRTNKLGVPKHVNR